MSTVKELNKLEKSKKVGFIYLSQEDCIKAGGLNMDGTLEAIQKSFELHGRKEVILERYYKHISTEQMSMI